VTVVLEFPDIPPSENSAYVQVGRMRKLSTPGKKFKRAFNEYAWDVYETEMDGLCEALGSNLWLKVDMELHLPLKDIVYLGWAKKSKKGVRGAKEPYRSMDGHNCVKLMADALSDAMKVDDRRFQWAGSSKYVDDRDPRVVLRLEVVDPKEFGVPREYTEE